MAGDIGESISFEASSLHSGSISFGRFESEPLYWERRSSFSHNQYLEEVEKYSQPGSVTEKKAYFEAHFKKKKALLCEEASECQNGMEDHTSDNDIVDHTNYLQETEHDNEDYPFDYENMGGLDDHGGPEVMEFEREVNEVSSEVSQMDPFVMSIGKGNIQEVEVGELHQTQYECDTRELGILERKVEEKQEFDNKAEKVDVLPDDEEEENVDRLPNGAYQSPMIQTTTNDCVAGVKNLREPKVKVLRKKTSGTSKECEKDTMKSEKMSTKTRKEKPPSRKATPEMSSQTRTVKAEDSKSLKAKPIQVKDQMVKKAKHKVQPLDPDKAESKSHNSANRPKVTAKLISARPDVKPSTAVFTLKSDERAEKRKEFFTKLEEKLHAKEVEVNQIEAKTQEEKEAQFREFRRSLNFKAKPMPSFYNEAVSQGSDHKKAALAPAKLTNLRSKVTSPGTRNSRSPKELTSKNQPSLATNEPVIRTVQPHSPSTSLPSEAANTSHNPSTNKNRNQKYAADKKEKRKDGNVQKKSGSEEGMVGLSLDVHPESCPSLTGALSMGNLVTGGELAHG